jgi:hypothetical protein
MINKKEIKEEATPIVPKTRLQEKILGDVKHFLEKEKDLKIRKSIDSIVKAVGDQQWHSPNVKGTYQCFDCGKMAPESETKIHSSSKDVLCNECHGKVRKMKNYDKYDGSITYLKPGEKPPEGANVKIAPMGHRYIDTPKLNSQVKKADALSSSKQELLDQSIREEQNAQRDYKKRGEILGGKVKEVLNHIIPDEAEHEKELKNLEKK